MRRIISFHPDYRDHGLATYSKPKRQLAVDGPVATPYQKSLQTGLTTLFVLLILEGLLRKLFHFLSIPLFFAKDFLVFYLGIKAFLGPLPKDGMKFIFIQVGLIILLIPCILNTVLLDPVLGLFGLKQYCLFPFVAAAVSGAYLPNQKEALLKLLRLLAFSVVATSGLAMIQNRLPPSHWLNVSPDGESLAMFSGGDYLRVTSSFSFIAQYAIYLNASLVFILTNYLLSPNTLRKKSVITFFIIVCFYIIGIFITGSRSSVLGCVAIILGAVPMMLIGKGISRLLPFLLMLFISLGAYQSFKVLYPQAFGAYEARSQGNASQSHMEEVEERVTKDLTAWMGKVKYSAFLGNGLGIQSNGSEKLSSYAASQKNRWGWMESDTQTVLFEGGVYLVSTWFTFRILMILYMAFCVISIKDPDLATASCFAWGFVAYIGIIGTLSVQPPTAIWWWFCIGLIICLKGFDSQSTSPAHKSH